MTFLIKTFIVILLFVCTFSWSKECITYRVSGNGQAVILMPGFVSDETVWQDMAARLSVDYQVHQIAIAGFGKNPACNKADTILQQVQNEVVQYINSRNLQQPVFIGHSLGGLLAFKLALDKDVKLAGAISVDGLPFIGPIFTRTNSTQVSDLQHQAKYLKAMYQSASQQDIERMTEQGIAIQTNLVNKYSDIVEMASKSDPTTAGSAIYSVMTTDLRRQLDTLNTPMLLIGASGGFNKHEDQVSVATLYQAQISSSDNIKLIMNTQGRHFLMWDQPKWLAKTIVQFIEVDI